MPRQIIRMTSYLMDDYPYPKTVFITRLYLWRVILWQGVPEFLIGIRNLVDAIFNQMIDRGSITNNPPIKVPP